MVRNYYSIVEQVFALALPGLRYGKANRRLPEEEPLKSPSK